MIIDRSKDNKIDTFFNYGMAGAGVNGAGVCCISAKKMTMEKTKEKRPVPEILAEASQQLKAAQKHGKMLVVSSLTTRVVCLTMICR